MRIRTASNDRGRSSYTGVFEVTNYNGSSMGTIAVRNDH